MSKAYPLQLFVGAGLCSQKLRLYYRSSVQKGQEIRRILIRFYNIDIGYYLGAIKAVIRVSDTDYIQNKTARIFRVCEHLRGKRTIFA